MFFKHPINKQGGAKMAEMIDVHGLPKEKIKLLQELVEFFRQKTKINGQMKTQDKEDIALGFKEGNVIGNLTRSEIYDHI
jgi:hypothetical protein